MTTGEQTYCAWWECDDCGEQGKAESESEALVDMLRHESINGCENDSLVRRNMRQRMKNKE